MIWYQTETIALSLFKIEPPLGDLPCLPALPGKYRDKAESLFGRAAAAELFALYFKEKYSAMPDRALFDGLRVACGERGKPYLPDYADFYYNISHAGDYAVAAWHKNGEIGVDIEKIRPYSPAVAARCFSSAAINALQNAPETEKDALFISLWTQKEAAVKLFGKSIFDDQPDEKDVMLLPQLPSPTGYCLCVAISREKTEA